MRKVRAVLLAGAVSIFQGIASAGSVPQQQERDLANATAAIIGNGGRFGSFVDNGGDLTGDGIADLVVGAWRDAGDAGRVYVFEGGPTLLGTLGVDDAFATFEGKPPCTSGLRCELGGDLADNAGVGGVVADVDGDSHSDLLVTGGGIEGDEVTSGGAYIFYGPLEEGTEDQPMLEPDAKLLGESTGDEVGLFEVEVGLVDDDPYPDVVIGAGSRAGTGFGGGTGSVYIVYGDGSRLSGDVRLFDAVELTGTPGVDAAFGRHMGIGELDGNNGRDLVLCGELALAASGRCYILYGGPRHQTGPIEDVYDASITGIQPGDLLCCATLADHDANGLHDVIVGSYGSGGMTGYNAIFYSDYGAENRLSGEVSTTDADATIRGQEFDDQAGWYASEGDLNADGVTDIVLTTFGKGTLHVFYGAAGQRLEGGLDMSGGNVRIASEHPGDSAGYWFEARGDVTGDDVDDLVIGAPAGCDDPDFQDGACTVTHGAAYIVAGGCLDSHMHGRDRSKHSQRAVKCKEE